MDCLGFFFVREKKCIIHLESQVLFLVITASAYVMLIIQRFPYTAVSLYPWKIGLALGPPWIPRSADARLPYRKRYLKQH